MNILDSDLPQVDLVTQVRAKYDPEEMDEEMAEAKNDEDLEEDEVLDEDDELANDGEAVDSDDDGYASL